MCQTQKLLDKNQTESSKTSKAPSQGPGLTGEIQNGTQHQVGCGGHLGLVKTLKQLKVGSGDGEVNKACICFPVFSSSLQ